MLILLKKEKMISCMITLSIIVALFLFANATKQERNTAAIEAASSIQEGNIQNIDNHNNEYFIQNME